MLVLDEVLGLELAISSRHPSLKPVIDNDHQVVVGTSNDLWFRRRDFDEEESPKRQSSKKTKALFE